MLRLISVFLKKGSVNCLLSVVGCSYDVVIFVFVVMISLIVSCILFESFV